MIMVQEFRELRLNGGRTKKQIIGQLAYKYGVSNSQIEKALAAIQHDADCRS